MKPGTKIYLTGTITSEGLDLRAGFHGNMEFGKKMILEDAHLVVAVSLTSVQVYVEGELRMKDAGSGKNVVFKGKECLLSVS